MEYGYLAPTLDRSNDDANFDSDNRYGLLETAEGDWIIGSTDELLLASSYEVLAQRLVAFMQTPKDSAEAYPEFGNRLHELYGKSLDNYKLLESAKQTLINDLNEAGFFPDESRIEILPYSGDSIMINVAIVNPVARTNKIIGQSYVASTGNYAIEFLGAVTY